MPPRQELQTAPSFPYPGSQTVHAPPPSRAQAAQPPWPVTQTVVLAKAPPADHVSGGHSTQKSGAAVALYAVPGGHDVHAPVLALHVMQSREQLVQFDHAWPDHVKGGHCTQVWLAPDRKVPGLQARQAPVTWSHSGEPHLSAQDAHGAVPRLYVPAVQFVQLPLAPSP